MDLNITLSMLKVIAVQSYFRLLKHRNDLEFSSSFTRVICEVTLNWKFLKGPSSWFVNYENVFLSSSLVNTIFFCRNYFQIIFRFTRIKHGIVKKKIKGSRNTFCYLEYGPTTAPTLLLVHGFSSSKESFFGVFKHIPRKFHVLAVDLPGHGETPLKDTDIGILHFVEAVNEVELEGKLLFLGHICLDVLTHTLPRVINRTFLYFIGNYIEQLLEKMFSLKLLCS